MDKEYVVIMVEDDDTEIYSYFDNENDSIEFAKKMLKEYKCIGIKLVDYKDNTEEIIWESGNDER